MAVNRASESLGKGLTNFLAWWGQELLGMVPSWLIRSLNPPPRRIAIAIGNEGLRLVDQLPNGSVHTVATLPNDTDARAKVAATLKRIGYGPSGNALLGIRLPVSMFLERTMELPLSARGQAADILAFDLERATPFLASQVYSSHYFGERSSDGKRIVGHQVVAKRETIDDAVDFAGTLGIEPQFADAYRNNPEAPLSIDFLAQAKTADTKADPIRSAALILLSLGLGLTALATYQSLHNQDRMLSDLQSRIAEVQVKALRVRKETDAVKATLTGQRALLLRRIGPPMTVQIIEELTRIVPNDAWISELRLDQGDLEIAGYSKSAAGLVPIIDKSPLFGQATLSSPVTMDPRYAAERFSIRCVVKGAAKLAQDPSSSGAAQ